MTRGSIFLPGAHGIGRGFHRPGPNQIGGSSAVLGRAGTPAGPVTVGGDVVGAAGTGFYSGYTLSWGDDFNSLSVVGPSTPTGKYFPTRAYLPGPRGTYTSTGLGTQYDTDPSHTGFQDSARGVSAGFSNMNVASSVLNLQARKATAGEQANMAPTLAAVNGGVRNEVAAMIHTAGAIVYYPSATGTVIVEARLKYTAKAGNPAGWHPTFWATSATPVVSGAQGGSDEWDYEGSSQSPFFNQQHWTSPSPPTFTTNAYGNTGISSLYDGNFHTITFVFRNGGTTELWVDGVQKFAPVTDSNPLGKPSYILLSSHIQITSFGGDAAYSKAVWDADADGATMSCDWLKVWRPSTAAHYKPLTSVSDLNVSYNGTGSIVLPSALTLWGDAAVTEYVQAIPHESIEPGNTELTNYLQFPTGVSYNSGTRTISVDFSTFQGNAGRVHCTVYAYKTDGSTCEPLRFAINRAPRLSQYSVAATVASPISTFDLYAAADCGIILPKSAISVSNLPSGLSYNSGTGLITGTPAALGSANISFSNALGQSFTGVLDFWQPSILSGLQFYWDTTDTNSMPDDGSGKVQLLKDFYDNTKMIAQSLTGSRPGVFATGGPNSDKRVMLFAAASSSLVSTDAAAANVTGIVACANTANATTGDTYACYAAKENATSTVNRLLGWYNAGGTNYLQARYTTTGRGVALTAAGGAQQMADQLVQDANWHIHEVVKSGSTLTYWIDGTQVATVTITQTGGITATMFLIGAVNSSGTISGGFAGQMGPGLVANVAPSLTDRGFARRWIGSKMGILVP